MVEMHRIRFARCGCSPICSAGAPNLPKFNIKTEQLMSGKLENPNMIGCSFLILKADFFLVLVRKPPDRSCCSKWANNTIISKLSKHDNKLIIWG